MKLEFFDIFLEKQSNFINIRPVGAALFHAGAQAYERTDRHDQVSSRFSQFRESAYKRGSRTTGSTEFLSAQDGNRCTISPTITNIVIPSTLILKNVHMFQCLLISRMRKQARTSQCRRATTLHWCATLQATQLPAFSGDVKTGRT